VAKPGIRSFIVSSFSPILIEIAEM